MAWYLRKSFKVGPMRLNLSKSGLRASVGVTGARIGVGPRGSYFHGGRHGLYVRKSLNSSKSSTTSQSAAAPDSLSSSLYINTQISRKDYSLNIDLKKPRIAPYTIPGIVLFIIGLIVYESNPAGGVAGVFLGLVLLAVAIVKSVVNWTVKLRACQLHKKLKTSLESDQLGNVKLNFERIKNALPDKTVKDQSTELGVSLFYRDVALSIIEDLKIKESEARDLKTLENIIGLAEENLARIKLWVFNKAYLRVIEDGRLTKEEEESIYSAKNSLALKDEDIKDELATLATLQEIRSLADEGLKEIKVDVNLQKNEPCYHKTNGKIVKEKVVKSYQLNGVRQKIADWVTEREGAIYLTSKRILIVGEGIYTINVKKIHNLETDADGNMVSIYVEGRKNALNITCPDSLIFSAKINQLLSIPSTEIT